jgi:site-specific recombinase XerD
MLPVSLILRHPLSSFQLKEWLGHARLDATSIYVHMAKQNAKKVMEATSL